MGCLVAPRSLAWICGAGGVQAVGFDGEDVWGALGWICGARWDLWGAHCSLLSCASVCGVHAVLTWGAELWGRALGSMGQSCGICGAELWGLWGKAVGSMGQSYEICGAELWGLWGRVVGQLWGLWGRAVGNCCSPWALWGRGGWQLWGRLWGCLLWGGAVGQSAASGIGAAGGGRWLLMGLPAPHLGGEMGAQPRASLLWG